MRKCEFYLLALMRWRVLAMASQESLLAGLLPADTFMLEL